MRKLFILLFVCLTSPVLAQSIGSPAGGGAASDTELAMAKIDSALVAFKNGRWRQVVALFDSIVTNNYFTNNQLYHAAYKSLEKLSEQSPPAEKDSLLHLSEEVYQESLEEWGKQVTDGGVDLKVYSIVEKNPHPVMGFKRYNQILQQNLRYPDKALAKGIEGKVFVQFVVNRDGSVDGLSVIKGLDPACDKEAIRLIKEGPQWKPGHEAGAPVYVRMTLPVSFNISEYKKHLKANN